MKEHPILFGNRPLAASPSNDFNTDLHGNFLDEDIAIRLGFKICNLQYVCLSLISDDANKRTRITGSVNSSIQVISHGRPGRTLALNAKVVRDLFRLTGAEALVEENFFKKLELDFLKSDQDTKICSSPDHASIVKIPATSKDATVPNVRVTKPVGTPQVLKEHSDEEPPWYLSPDPKLQAILNHCGGQGLQLHCEENSTADDSMDNSSERDSSECMDYSSCSSDEGDSHVHRLRCPPHGEAYVNRVRGRNKSLQEARSRVTEEAVEEERIKRSKDRAPDDILNESFPGGAQYAHHLSKLWARKDDHKIKKEKEEQDKLKKPKIKKRFGLSEKQLSQIRKAAKAAKKLDSSDSD